MAGGARASPIGHSHQEKVAHKPGFGVSDHPVCGAKVGCAEIFLMPQPPLLTRRGVRSPIWLRLALLYLCIFVISEPKRRRNWCISQLRDSYSRQPSSVLCPGRRGTRKTSAGAASVRRWWTGVTANNISMRRQRTCVIRKSQDWTFSLTVTAASMPTSADTTGSPTLLCIWTDSPAHTHTAKKEGAPASCTLADIFCMTSWRRVSCPISSDPSGEERSNTPPFGRRHNG